MNAREIMDRQFHFLDPDETIVQAVTKFEQASCNENKMIFGMLVIDETDRLVGMLSMYDILLFIQPKHLDILGQVQDLSFAPVFEKMVRQMNDVRVKDIMSTDLITASPDEHLMVVIDTMVKNHIRRMPVVDEKKVVGILYRSDVFRYLMQHLIKTGVDGGVE